MASYKLTYFDVRGRAEVSRMLFHASGVAFEDVRLSVDSTGRCPEWAGIKERKFLKMYLHTVTYHTL